MGPVKIGTKLTVGADNGPKRKIYTNGHKTFTPMEALAMTQTQRNERRTLENFERDKFTVTRDPNPLQGETERSPAFPTEFYVPKVIQPEVLTANSSLLPENSLRRSNKSVECVNCLQNLQDNINGELDYLVQLKREKEAKLKEMRSKVVRF